MMNPDEALLWAREQAKGRYRASCIPSEPICAEIDAGGHDDDLSDEAQAYRAGAAASEARIKALEAMVRKLVALHDTPIHPGDTYEVARAMVKEADQ